MEHALRSAHLPQHVDVDRALAPRHLISALDLRHGAVDRILDQFFVAFATRQPGVDLRDDPPFGIIAIRIDRRDGADPAGGSPGATAGMVGRRNALAAFDQRPDLPSAIKDGLQPFKQAYSPGRDARPFVRPYKSGCSPMR